jgi:hypothetical protein
MAVTKTLTKNDRQRAVVHIIGTAAGDSSTILLTDLLAADETSSSSVTLRANISVAYANTDGASGVTISRNSTPVLKLHTFSEYPGANQLPSIAIGNNSSIVVTFGDPGMVVLDLRKVEGFVSPNTNVGV